MAHVSKAVRYHLEVLRNPSQQFSDDMDYLTQDVDAAFSRYKLLRQKYSKNKLVIEAIHTTVQRQEISVGLLEKLANK